MAIYKFRFDQELLQDEEILFLIDKLAITNERILLFGKNSEGSSGGKSFWTRSIGNILWGEDDLFKFNLIDISDIYYMNSSKSLIIEMSGYRYAFPNRNFESQIFIIQVSCFINKYLSILNDWGIRKILRVLFQAIFLNQSELILDAFKNTDQNIEALLSFLVEKQYLNREGNIFRFTYTVTTNLDIFFKNLIDASVFYIVNIWPKEEDIKRKKEVTIDSITNLFTRVRKIHKNDLIEFTQLSNQILLGWLLQIDPETPITLDGEFILVNDDPLSNQLIIKAINQLVAISDEIITK